MTDTPETIMARAFHDNLPVDDSGECKWRYYLPEAQAAISALKEAGYVICPVEALATIEQTILEVSAAQDRGAGWYTCGASGLYQQVAMHVGRANKALAAIQGKQ